MLLHIQLFASAREKAGKEKIELNVVEDWTIKECLDLVTKEYPSLHSDFLNLCRIASNKKYISLTDKCKFHTLISIIPPISGG